MNDMTELRPTLRSEWRELRRNRSMLKWFAVLAVVSIVLTTLLAFLNFDEPAENGERAQYLAVLGVTAPNRLGQLLIGVLGALIVSGRRGRRMSRRAVAVSAATFAAATLIVSTAMYAILVVITVVVLASSGTTVDLSEGKLWVSLLGGVMNLPLAGLVGFAIGAIVRGPIAAVAATLGLLLVAPIVASIAGADMRRAWLYNITRVLPSEAGTEMANYWTAASDGWTAPEGYLRPDAGQSGLILLVWVVVLLTTALIAWRRRDA